MVADNHYNDDALINLLRKRMGGDEETALAHVESCTSCQERLDTISQSGITWDEVSDLLRPSTQPGDGFSFAVDNDDKQDSSPTFLEPSDHPGSLGRFARYEIMELLGRGGMGIVMRGFDTSLNRHSAIKVLAPELATSAAARKRFSREAKSAAAVVHAHVVPIQTVDEHNGLPYLVMPVVEGQSLQQRVDQDGPLAIIEAVRIAAQVAEGLQAAHEQGLVHRDIKPANVLLENGVERVQITDFGLARAIDDASMTRSGVIAGTPQYMSPEQAHGDTIDHRSDLFSLGSLMYFMLTGHSPFRAETTMGVLNRIGNDASRSIRSINADVPEWLEQIVMKLLSKPADDRFQTAAEVSELLQDWHAHLQQPESVQPPQALQTPLAPGSGSRSRVLKWLMSAAAFSFLIFGGIIITLELSKGTLTIESEVEDIPIRIMQGGEVVEKMVVSKTDTSVRIGAGKYVVEIDGEFDGIEVDSGDVTLQKRGTNTVRIVHRPRLVTPAPGPGQSALDRPLTSAELTGILTPDVVLEHGQQLSGYRKNPIRVAFRVGCAAQQDWYGDSKLWYLTSSESPSDLGQGILKVYVPEDVETQLQEAGFNDFNEELKGMTVTVTGDINVAKIIPSRGPTVSTYSMAIQSLSISANYQYGMPPQVFKSASNKRNLDVLPTGSGELPADRHLTLEKVVEQFNSKMASADGDFPSQPPLTVDELVCRCGWYPRASAYVSTEANELHAAIGLGQIWPEKWSIEGGKTKLVTSEGDVDVYRIQLISSSSDTKITVRERYLSPPANFHERQAADLEDTATPLDSAITEFNAMHKQVAGQQQPSLTKNEVLAAIVAWSSKRNDAPVDNKTFANFQRIAETHQLPADTKFDVISNFENEKGDVARIWSVRILMPQVAKPGWTYAFTIRKQHVSLDWFQASDIHWGKPNEQGLQAGFRLVPGQRIYQIGQQIETEFFYRSILHPVTVNLPNVFSHTKLIADGPNGSLDVVEVPNTTIGGAMETTIGDSPVRRKGKPLGLGYITPIPEYDFFDGIPPETCVTVKPGQTIFLQYIVSDLNGGKLQTARIAIETVDGLSDPPDNAPIEKAAQFPSPYKQSPLQNQPPSEQKAETKPNATKTEVEQPSEAEAMGSSRASQAEDSDSALTSSPLKGSWRVTHMSDAESAGKKYVPHENILLTFDDFTMKWVTESEPPAQCVFRRLPDNKLEFIWLGEDPDDEPSKMIYELRRLDPENIDLSLTGSGGTLHLHKLLDGEIHSTYVSEAVPVDTKHNYGWPASEVVLTHIRLIQKEGFLESISWPDEVKMLSEDKLDALNNIKANLLLKSVDDQKIEIGMHGHITTMGDRNRIVNTVADAYVARINQARSKASAKLVSLLRESHAQLIMDREAAEAKHRQLLLSDKRDEQKLKASTEDLRRINELMSELSDKLLEFAIPALGGSLQGSLDRANHEPSKMIEDFRMLDPENIDLGLPGSGGTLHPHKLPTLGQPTLETASSKSSPDFPHVEVSVVDVDGLPVVGAKVTMVKFSQDGRTVLTKASDDVSENGLAINRRLPHGRYKVNVETQEAWQGSQNDVQVEFDKPLQLKIVAPRQSEFAQLQLKKDWKPSKDALADLRFGVLENHDNQSKGAWANHYSPEPDEDVGRHKSFPQMGLGITDVVLGVQLTVEQSTKQPDGSQLVWQWSPALANRHFLVDSAGFRGVANVDFSHGEPQTDGDFSDIEPDYDCTVRIGYWKFTYSDAAVPFLEARIPVGRVDVYVTEVYGRPKDAPDQGSTPLKSIGLSQPTSSNEEILMQAHLRDESKWLPRLLDISDWQSAKQRNERRVYFPNLLRQTHEVEAGDSLVVEFTTGTFAE